MSVSVEISEFAWFMIMIMVIAICVATGLTLTEIKKGKPDPLAEQIEAINNSFTFASDKAKLVSEVIARYNPTNTIKEVENNSR